MQNIYKGGLELLDRYLQKARQGQPVWLPELRDALAGSDAAVPVIFSLQLCSGERMDRCQYLPKWRTAEEREFAREYLNACVFNTLAAASGRELRFFPMEREESVLTLLDGLEWEFAQGGLAKCVTLANRIGRSFGGGGFRFTMDKAENYRPPAPETRVPGTMLAARLRQAAAEAGRACCCGVDVGGTDIKLVAARGERLVCVKEYDWNPAESPRAEGIIDPILLLVRLMRACLAAEGTALFQRLVPALEKDAPPEEIALVVEHAEEALGERINVLDAIGLSFPDVVIHDRIVGGETPKTRGMRNNPALDYEAEFSKLTALKERLDGLCRPQGRVHIINDGAMAAFTAAMELAHSGDAALIEKGVIAHSLGTDLGTGWLTGEGTIPALPLELYDCLLDLGSLPKREFAPHDLRCVCNENSGLPGVRRYMGQAAAFRLAWEQAPELLEGFVTASGDVLSVQDKEPDLRKACLEHLMVLAEAGDARAEQVFISIGANLGQVCREMEFLFRTGLDSRFIFGRFAKRPRCFALLCQGCAETAPGIRLVAADSGMAYTPLMCALSRLPGITVAQFGQAVGSAYYAFL